jgi:transforming growth factor-beta-induced protein
MDMRTNKNILRRRKMKHPLIIALLATLVLAACAPAATPTPVPAPTNTPMPTEAPKTIVDVAVADGRFTTLVAAVQAAGLVETLSGEGPFTVFAPTDEAFAKLPAGTLDELLKPENKQQLTDILLYHVVPGKVMAADVVNLTEAETALGEKAMVKVEGGKVFINEAEVIITDVVASNGVIHVIDTVILPPAEEKSMDVVDIAAADGRFTTLVAAVQAAGLVETLKGEGPFTVFAPTDEAFAKLPAGTLDELLKPENKQQLTDILLYHVIPGKVMAASVTDGLIADSALGTSLFFKVDMGSAYVNEAKIVLTDIEASNGVIHVIDTVILPKDIVDAAVFNKFDTLAAALQAAELVETLKGEGPFTVFAPTEEAFKALPEGTLANLLLPENKQTLTDILLYHVVSGRVLAEDVVKLESADTVLGQPANIKVMGGKVYINEAQVILTDIKTTNGVIHVIDAVLLPSQ